ncbi:DUF3024 domain-containing protein [Sulfuriferula sp.]|uniref:DUF3024 domain-containing protein n=1 Tax=Sulfuriferula sp. TaxID=2025307 RepID=UPI0027311446|nr:DUF3024 domain-containing protein [Sulfuriferula sp.]MDP2024962.1 DUF3024 domain-containing protein [Sulfuriferula sp.]
MSFSELEYKRIEKRVDAFIETRRPPPAIRDQLDLGFRLQGQSVELFEIRPVWDNPDQKQEFHFAKATYVKTQNIWKVYWMRADLKWHSYPATPTVKTLDAFLAVVAEDKHACFFG